MAKELMKLAAEKETEIEILKKQSFVDMKNLMKLDEELADLETTNGEGTDRFTYLVNTATRIKFAYDERRAEINRKRRELYTIYCNVKIKSEEHTAELFNGYNRI